MATKHGKFNTQLVEQEYHWTQERFSNNLLELIQEGMIWKDDQTKNKDPDYYFPDIN